MEYCIRSIAKALTMSEGTFPLQERGQLSPTNSTAPYPTSPRAIFPYKADNTFTPNVRGHFRNYLNLLQHCKLYLKL